MHQLGLYIHFPFCRKKCMYCDFPSYSGMEEWMDSYLCALIKEIDIKGQILSDSYNIKTIFLGGGTPTLFSGGQIQNILDTCYKRFHICSDVEITAESNPGTLDRPKLYSMRSAGINRLSIGLQAWQDRLLGIIGRIHKQRDFIDSIDYAKAAGFHNISADIMFGLPTQTMDEWLETLDKVCNMDIEHISAYSLKIEEGTKFYDLMNKGVLHMIDEDTERDMYHTCIDVLERYGFKQYEISNFAKHGFECRHNLIYWKNQEYIGCGSGAYSFINCKRFANTVNIAEYVDKIENNQKTVAFEEDIDKEIERFETIMMNLRLNRGIIKKDFHDRFGFPIEYFYGNTIKRLKASGLILEDNYSVKLTNRGRDIQNTVLLAFMD